jgi:hypothetical protein
LLLIGKRADAMFYAVLAACVVLQHVWNSMQQTSLSYTKVAAIGAALATSCLIIAAVAPAEPPRTAMSSVKALSIAAAMYSADTDSIDVPGTCTINDEHFATLEGGCTDLNTGITYSAVNYYPDAGSTNLTFSGASSFCSNLDQGGFTDWRLPTLAEIEATGDNNLAAGHGDHFADLPGTGLPFESGVGKWTSTTDKSKRYGYWGRLNGGTTDKVLITFNKQFSLTRANCVR